MSCVLRLFQYNAVYSEARCYTPLHFFRHRQPLWTNSNRRESRICSRGGPLMLPLHSEHVDDVGEEHQTDDGEEHQYQDVQHDVCVSAEQRVQKMPSHPSRCLHENERMDCGDPSPPHF